jgi:hypothetical protein
MHASLSANSFRVQRHRTPSYRLLAIEIPRGTQGSPYVS